MRKEHLGVGGWGLGVGWGGRSWFAMGSKLFDRWIAEAAGRLIGVITERGHVIHFTESH